MFEFFFFREEDGLKVVSWGFFVIRVLLGFKGGDGVCVGLFFYLSEELMFIGYV